jgi:hypothetical protein
MLACIAVVCPPYPLAPRVVERLAADPKAALEAVMRRRWPDGWDDQVDVLAATN